MKIGFLKRSICTVLVLSLIFSLSVSATTIDDVEITDGYQDEIIDNSNYVVDQSELTHTPYEPLAEEDIPIERPTDLVISDEPEDAMLSYAPRAVYGPYTKLETMADEKMSVVVNGLKSAGSLKVVKYAGYNCYKFVSNGNTVYVTCDAFYRQQKATVTRSVSDVVTAAINKGSSNPLYTTVIRSKQYTYNGMKVFRWSFARVSVRAFHAKNNSEVVMNVTVQNAYDFDAYYAGLQDIGTSTAKISPTMAIRVTKSPNGLYFDSYEFRGQGENTSRSELGNLVSIAYSAKKITGTIASASLHVGTVYNICKEILKLTKTNSSNRKSYLTDLTPLSSSNRYLYKFETPVPYPIKLTGDYATMELGITYTGNFSSATNYNAYYGWTIS